MDVLSAPRMRAPIFRAKYGERDQQRPAPGELLPVGIGALHEVVDGDRQVRHRLGHVEAEELVRQRGEQQRRGFAGDAGGREQHAGDQARARGAIGDPPDHQRARQAERGRRLAQRIGHQPQHVLGGAHHHGDHDHGERQAAGEGREAAHRHHDGAVDEQADDDRRRAQQDVVDEADHRGELVVLAVFGQIRAGEQAERRADADADHGHHDRADDGVAQAAIGRTRRRRILGEDGEVDAGEAVVEQREQDQRQPGDAEQRGAEAQELDDDVDAAAGCVNRVHDLSSPPSFPAASASAARQQARRTSARTASRPSRIRPD